MSKKEPGAKNQEPRSQATHLTFYVSMLISYFYLDSCLLILN